MTLTTTSQQAAVRTITLNRPEQRNVLTVELLEDLCRELRDAFDDVETSVVVIRGAGPGFSAGVDISGRDQLQATVWNDRERMRRTYSCLAEVFDCPLPVIASVHGFALGGGADLALHCDFLIAADDAVIGHPAVRDVGVPPTTMWLYRLGPQLAKRLLLTGDRVNGEEAARIGLALYSCPAADLDGTVAEFAAHVATVGRECLIGNKFVLNRGVDLMGRPTLNRIAETEDAITHTSGSAQEFFRQAHDTGVSRAARARDGKFTYSPSRIAGSTS